jgi:hypothetical protein
MSLTLGRFVEFPRAAPSGIPQTSLGFRGHLITNFPHIMVLLIIILIHGITYTYFVIYFTIRTFDLHGLFGAQSWRFCLF